MATMVTDITHNKNIIAIAVSGALLVSSATAAGEIEFTPKLTATATHTDNVELTQFSETSSLVSQLGLELVTEYQSQYASFSLNSNSQYATYSHDHEIDKDYHTLSSAAEVMLWPNGITFNAQANISNVSRNTAVNSLASIVTDDTVRLENYSAGLGYDVNNSDFIISANSNYQITKSEDNLGENEGWTAYLQSQNGQSAKHLFWSVSSSYQDLKNNGQDAQIYRAEVISGWISGIGINPFIRYYDEENEGTINQNRSLETNSFGLGVRWLATPRLYLDLSYNKPVGDQIDFEGELIENYWDARINWQPSKRTSLDLTASERFYGDSYSANFSHKIKRLENQITYNEQVQTFTRNNYRPFLVGTYWCPISENVELNTCFISDGQNINFDNYQLINFTDFELLEDQEYSLMKTLSWVTKLNLPRTSLGFQANKRERLNLETAIEDKYLTLGFDVSRKVSGNSDLRLGLSYTENQLSLGQDNETLDRYREYNLEYSKELNSRLNFKFGISHLNRTSDTTIYNYKEQRIYLQAVKGF